MKAFGIKINQRSLPFAYLACISFAFFLIRQSYPAFWPSISTRAITVFLELGFILLAAPNILKLKEWNVSKKYLFIISLWVGLTGLSTLLGDYSWTGSIRWFELIVNLIFGLSIYLLIQQSPEYKAFILYSLILSLLFTLVIYLGLWFTLDSPYNYKWVGSSPFFNNIRHYGYFIATALPLGYWLLESNIGGKNKKYTAIIYLSLAWALLFWTGGRGALLGVFFATACYFIISQKNIRWVVLSILLGGILSQFFIVKSGSLNLFHALSWFATEEKIDLNAISANRIKIYTDSLNFWWENSPILGTGSDAFRYIKPSINGISQPHSIIIQLIFSYGILGILIPAGLFIALTFSQFKSGIKQNNIIYLCILSAIVHALTDGVFYHAYSLLALSILIALSMPATKEKTKPYLKSSIALILLSLLAYSIFTAQVIQSKNVSASKIWIHWNMQYPLYFSPENWLDKSTTSEKDRLIEFSLTHTENKCWFYSRYSNANTEQLEQYCQ
jgi:hypothetical protein